MAVKRAEHSNAAVALDIAGQTYLLVRRIHLGEPCSSTAEQCGPKSRAGDEGRGALPRQIVEVAGLGRSAAVTQANRPL